MRIVVWNCNMALHRKIDRLLALKPDVAVVPECATPELLRQKAALFIPEHFRWMAVKSEHKGLGVFAFGRYGLELPPGIDPDPELRVMLPLRVTGPTPFNLLAAWSFNATDGISASDPGPLLRAIDRYGSFLSQGQTVVAGDFNNHRVFDKPGRACNFLSTVPVLNRLGLHSVYHRAHGLTHEQDEPHPTLFWMRHRDKPYHIDYCFASSTLIDRMTACTVGSFDEWGQHSDHMPLVVDFAD
jgi:exodeoxyribonuclease III